MPKSEINEQEETLFWDELLDCESDMQFQRFCINIAAKLESLETQFVLHKDKLFKNVEAYARRRVYRRTEINECASRRLRTNLPFTWYEDKILRWAIKPTAEVENYELDVEYLAHRLLNRATAEVDRRIVSLKNNKLGMKGFDL